MKFRNLRFLSVLRLIRPVLVETVIIFVATLILLIWRIFEPTNLLFDQFCVISALIFILSFALKYSTSRSANSLSKIKQAAAISLVSSLLYFSIVQYTVLAIDRSRSFYVLSWIDQGLFIDEKNQYVLIDKKLPTNIDLDPNNLVPINQRISEQISRKLVTFQDSNLVLTTAGKAMLKISNYTAKIFNLNGWKSNTSFTDKTK